MFEENSFSYKRSFNGMFFLFRKSLIGMLILGVIVGLVVKIGISKFQTPTYSATSAIYVASASGAVINFSDLQAGSLLTADYSYLIKSKSFIAEVKRQLNLGDEYPSSKISKMISTKIPTNTHIVEIKAVSKDGKLAADVANALAEISASRISDITETSHPKVVEYAIAKRVGTDSTTSAGLLAILAMAVYYVVELLKFWADDTVHSPEDVETLFEINSLGIVNGAPDDKEKKRRRYDYDYGDKYGNGYGYGYGNGYGYGTDRPHRKAKKIKKKSENKDN